MIEPLKPKKIEFLAISNFCTRFLKDLHEKYNKVKMIKEDKFKQVSIVRVYLE